MISPPERPGKGQEWLGEGQGWASGPGAPVPEVAEGFVSEEASGTLSGSDSPGEGAPEEAPESPGDDAPVTGGGDSSGKQTVSRQSLLRTGKRSTARRLTKVPHKPR